MLKICLWNADTNMSIVLVNIIILYHYFNIILSFIRKAKKKKRTKRTRKTTYFVAMNSNSLDNEVNTNQLLLNLWGCIATQYAWKCYRMFKILCCSSEIFCLLCENLGWSLHTTAWKVCKYGVFSFPNTEQYGPE